MTKIIFILTVLATYPVAAVSSQSLLDLCIILLGGVWLSEAVKNRSAGFKKIGVEWSIIAYVIVIILGFIINAPPEAPMGAMLLKFTWVFWLYLLIYLFERTEIDYVKALTYVSGVLLIPTIYSLISYARGFDIITGRENSRLTGMVNSSTYHAHGNAVIFVFLVSLLIFLYKKISKPQLTLILTSLTLLFISIVLTWVRGIWLSMAISSILFVFLISPKKSIALIFLIIISVFVLREAWPKFNGRIDHSSSTEGNIERIQLFKVNVEMWQEYPILGIGYGENIRRNREYWDRPEWHLPPERQSSHAHNQYLNVLSTTGILGFICFMSMILFFLVKNYKLLKKASKNKTSINYIILFSCLWAQVEFYLACVSDVSFEYAKIRALIIMVWALVIATEHRLKKAELSEPA